MTQQTTVAVLGTGTIGSPIAVNLAKAGYQVVVWNRTPSRAAELSSEGIIVAESPAAAARDADIVLTVLKDAPAVLEVLEQIGGGFRAGAILVQIATVGAAGIEDIARVAAEYPIGLVDAPVLGTKGPAMAGQLVVLASGSPSHRERVDPLFAAIGKNTIWVAEEPGHASRLKVVLNALVASLTHGVAESFRLADALDVDPELVLQAISGGPLDSPFVMMKARATVARDFEPSFTITNAIKDAQLVVDAAERGGAWLPVSNAGLQRFQSAADTGHGPRDMAASYFADGSEGVTHG